MQALGRSGLARLGPAQPSVGIHVRFVLAGGAAADNDAALNCVQRSRVPGSADRGAAAVQRPPSFDQGLHALGR